MRHTRVYRRDIPRVQHGPLRRKYNTDDASWNNVLEWLEKRRTKAASGFLDDHFNAAHTFYEYGLDAIAEVGGDTSDFTQNADAWEVSTTPQQKRLDLQRLATRLSHTFNPKEKEGDGNGQGKGKNEEGQSAAKARPQPEPDEEEKENEEDDDWTPAESSGGDSHYGVVEDDSLFYAVRYLISKLAEHDDYSEMVPFGHARWDAKRVISSYWDPLMLEEAKQDYARQVDDVYLILDTSGSVSALANNIAAIAAGAAGIVHLYSGEEARPQRKVERTTPLRTSRDPFPEWENQSFVHSRERHADYKAWLDAFMAEYKPLYPEWTWGADSFEAELAWFLHVEKPPKGSRILFWGDTCGALFGCPRLLAALLRPYRPAWLYSTTFDADWDQDMRNAFPPERLIYKPRDLNHVEWPKLEAVGIPVIENIRTAENVRGMLQTLQMLR